MTDLRFMPIYWGDFLADTSHLSGLQSGSYLLLLGQMWLRGGSVPDDDEQLARMCRLSLPEWLEVRPFVRPFLRAKRGHLSQKRLLSLYKSALETHLKNRVNTAQMRQAKRKQQDTATKEDIARARPERDNTFPAGNVTDTTPLYPPKGGTARKRASKPKNPMVEEVKRRMAAAKEDDYGNGYFLLPPESHH